MLKDTPGNAKNTMVLTTIRRRHPLFFWTKKTPMAETYSFDAPREQKRAVKALAHALESSHNHDAALRISEILVENGALEGMRHNKYVKRIEKAVGINQE